MAQRQAFGLQLDQSSQPFDYLPQFFTQHFIRDLDYPIPQLQASFDVCAHIPLTLWVSTFHIMLMAMNTLKPMMQFTIPLLPLCEMLVSIKDKNNYMHFVQPHSTPFIDELTLCLPKMAFAPQPTLSLSTQCNGFTSLILQNSRICCVQCSSSQGKELLQSTPH